MDLRDRHVLLTGASGGIGRALAVALAARGARLTLTSTRQDALDELAAQVGGSTIVADFTRPEAPEKLLAAVETIDVLVANAALPATGLLSDFSVEQIDRALDVNLRAPIILAKLASVQMAARGSGHLVFISSLSGKTASGQTSLYCATKFGIRGFAQALREDLRPRGVGVSTLFPGPVREAGMIADTQVKIPRLATRAPREVAEAAIRAIEKNIGELDVAPLPLRLTTLMGAVAPAFAAAVERRTGNHKIVTALSEGQRTKR